MTDVLERVRRLIALAGAPIPADDEHRQNEARNAAVQACRLIADPKNGLSVVDSNGRTAADAQEGPRAVYVGFESFMDAVLRGFVGGFGGPLDMAQMLEELASRQARRRGRAPPPPRPAGTMTRDERIAYEVQNLKARCPPGTSPDVLRRAAVAEVDRQMAHEAGRRRTR